MIKFHRKDLSNISDDAIIGDECVIHSHVSIYSDVVIGKNCKIQTGVSIPNGITIGDFCFLGPGVRFANDPRPPSNHKGWEKTFVGDGVVIGIGAIILSGVTIGKNAMVGAGSLVTKDIPEGEVWIGSPARFYKKREDL